MEKPPLAERSTTPSATPVAENTPIMVSDEEVWEDITPEMATANSRAKPSMEIK